MSDSSCPVAIGGVGGSGTRLVAELVRAAGVHLGDDLNAASDNLWFTLLFKRVDIHSCSTQEFDLLTSMLVAGLRRGCAVAGDAQRKLRELAAADRPQHSSAWLRARAESLVSATGRPSIGCAWGWKEPNTHVVIEPLWERLPDLRYVHVVRHGVDMAYSKNQNQVKLWGPQVLGDESPVTPQRSLAYWCRVHQRMQRLLSANPQRMYWLDYDALCQDPATEVPRLLEFLGSGQPDVAAALVTRVRPPAAARSRRRDARLFPIEDIEYAQSLGYQVQHAD